MASKITDVTELLIRWSGGERECLNELTPGLGRDPGGVRGRIDAFGAAASLCRCHGAVCGSRLAQTGSGSKDYRRASKLPWFIRISYAWLLIASALWVAAAWADRGGGIWGAARHALTVGFISTMVFSIGQRILPAFGGARILYSPQLVLASLAALTLGCALRVSAEIPAYEGNSQIAWHVLPCSAIIERSRLRCSP